MNNPLQTIQTTSDGTSRTSTKREKNKSEEIATTEFQVVDDTIETVNSFLSKIAVAQGAGESSIETTDAVIAFFNKKGLNGAKYFIYGGIKVYPLGKTAEIEAEESISAEERLHGTSGGRVTPIRTDERSV